MVQRVKFINKDKTQFYSELKRRVDFYFKEHNISPHANGLMVFKTTVMLGMYIIPYVFILAGLFNIWGLWVCCIIMGFGAAGIGMSVMHDANHGAYSPNNFINKCVGYTLNLAGGDANNWKIQHNILHHTYTNIYRHDEDIDDKVGMRFSPSGSYTPIQRFQAFYVFFFYSLMTLYWTTVKDFMQYARYVKNGQNSDVKRERIRKLFVMIAFKLVYYFVLLVLPMWLLDITWWQVLIGFLSMHFVTGMVLSVVFQLAHVVEATHFPVPDDKGNIENEWAIHQMQTTADFARDNHLLTFYVGGLNYQTEHHLFPRICHVHYPRIAPIVEQTAREFGIPYLYYPSFKDALSSHIRHMTKLGKNQIAHVMNEMG